MSKRGHFSATCKRGHSRVGREGKVCLECHRVASQKYWAKNKTKAIQKQARFRQINPDYAKEYNRRIRKEALDYYGGKCFCCGETVYEFLTFDHVKGGGTQHRKELGGGGTKLVMWLRRNNYPEGFRVACHNCNASLGLYGFCPHGENNEL